MSARIWSAEAWAAIVAAACSARLDGGAGLCADLGAFGAQDLGAFGDDEDALLLSRTFEEEEPIPSSSSSGGEGDSSGVAVQPLEEMLEARGAHAPSIRRAADDALAGDSEARAPLEVRGALLIPPIDELEAPAARRARRPGDGDVGGGEGARLEQ